MLNKLLLKYKQLWNIMLMLHSNFLAHKDIKAENILFNPVTNEIKLFDFGFAGFYPVSKMHQFIKFVNTMTKQI